MTMELMSTVATAAGVVSFAAVFTLLYRSYAKSACGEVTSGARDVEMIESYVRDNQPKQRLQKKLGSIAKKICFYALMACLIPILAISVVQRASGDEVVIGDRTLMVVASGSMSECHWSNEYAGYI